MANEIYCSFCGKTDHEVFVLISGPTTLICDECVTAAQEIITAQRIEKAARNTAIGDGQDQIKSEK